MIVHLGFLWNTTNYVSEYFGVLCLLGFDNNHQRTSKSKRRTLRFLRSS
jgi:hypothetical protein